MRRKKRTGLSFLTLWILLAGFGLAADSFYGHISFVDNEALVARADGSECRAQVNLPVAPGDTVVTAAAGRCELQFDNGTVVRLDKDSRLRVATVLAPSLTSRWKITTLELLRGQIFTLPQTYHREMFQVVTPNATVNLSTRTAAFIRLDAGGGSSFFCDSGRFELLYGEEGGVLRKARVRSGQSLVVSAANALGDRPEPRSLEFIAWNEYVNRHFKELHHAVSKVPANLSRFKNQALVLWAEKWSSLFGEWIYDDLFGYVWKPADERFALAERPFFLADIVRINGQMFLVPQQPWGWVPAHLGTWVWLKHGWTWIPGNWFHPGIVDFQGTYAFPSLNYYVWLAYGNTNLYTVFHTDGLDAWRVAYPKIFKHELKKPDTRALPPPIEKILRRARTLPDAPARLGLERALPVVDKADRLPAIGPVRAAPDRFAFRADKAGEAGHALARDWNPDRRWATSNGTSIRYSSSSNAVLCPELKVSSRELKGIDRLIFREAVIRQASPAALAAPAGGNPANAAGSNPAQGESPQPVKLDGQHGQG